MDEAEEAVEWDSHRVTKEAVLAGCFLDELPKRLSGDKAYDSDGLDKQVNAVSR